MNYTFQLNTPYSNYFQQVGEETFPQLIFKFSSTESYPKIFHEELDLISILNEAKSKFLHQEKNSWIDFHEQLLLKKQEIDVTPHFNSPHMMRAYKREFAVVLPIVKNQINIRYMENALLKKLVNENNNIPNKENKYNVFLPTLKKVLAENLRQKKMSRKLNIYYQYILNNLPTIINTLIKFESKMLTTDAYMKEKTAFKSIYNICYPILNTIYKNKNYKTLDRYYFEFEACSTKYEEERSNIKDFVPAGSCHFLEKIFLNMDSWIDKTKVKDKNFTIESIKEVLLHELGHAVDFPNERAVLLKGYEPFIGGVHLSSTEDFLKTVKKCYKNTRVLSFKQKKLMQYYVYPQYNIYSSEEYDILLNDATIGIDWERPHLETWAQSFAILSKWFLYGFNELDTLTIQAKRSNQRVQIKTLMPSLMYMLQNLNWKLIGIPSILLLRRRKVIKQMLNKIDTLPIRFNDGDKRSVSYRKKLNCYVKPTTRFLIK